MKDNKYLILALSFAILNAGAIFIIFGFQSYGDSQSWINAISWFGGGTAEISPLRAIRPLGPLMAVPFEFLGGGAGLIIQNIIFYLLAVILVFKIVELIYNDKLQALIASLFFMASSAIIQYGLSYLVDMGPWFFNLLSIFLTLIYFKNKREGLIVLNGFLSGIGALVKESGALGALFFGLMVLFSREFILKDKILKITRFALFFVIPIAIVQVLMFKYFDFTYLNLYAGGGTSTRGEPVPLIILKYLGQLFGVLGILWIFFSMGLWRELSEKNKERIKIYLALLPSSFSFLLWSIEAGGRLVFIFAPIGVLLASRGVVFLAEKLGKMAVVLITLLVFTVFLQNYLFSWLNSKYQFVEIIAKFLGIL